MGAARRRKSKQGGGKLGHGKGTFGHPKGHKGQTQMGTRETHPHKRGGKGGNINEAM